MMDYIFVAECDLEEMPKDFFDKEQYLTNEEKSKILKYMKAGECFSYTSYEVSDYVTGEKTEHADNMYTDGKYCWTFGIMYAFEKYDIPLEKEFIECVLKGVSKCQDLKE